jgi:hypothetical protein
VEASAYGYRHRAIHGRLEQNAVKPFGKRVTRKRIDGCSKAVIY